MNRQIKFRGKRCRDGQWVYGFYCEATATWKGCHQHKSWILGTVRSNGGWFALQGAIAVIDDTVGQFTGLTDMNGVEIYEGDVVEYRCSMKHSNLHGLYNYGHPGHEPGTRFVVRCLKSGFTLVRLNDNTPNAPSANGKIDNYWLWNIAGTRLAVVCNIHDIPEIMK